MCLSHMSAFFVVLSKRFPVASLALRECSAIYNYRAVSLCLSLVLLLRIAKVPPSRSPALWSVWRAYPFSLISTFGAFAMLFRCQIQFGTLVIAASAIDRSPIDFRALCDDQRALLSSWISYVSRSHGRCVCLWQLQNKGPRTWCDLICSMFAVHNPNGAQMEMM